MKLDGKSIAFLHTYPKLAGLSDPDRRDILRRHTGCASASDDGFYKHTFEAAMAAYEAVLWQRVELGVVPDPRACTKCGRRLVRAKGLVGECPEGCETRRVQAWEPRYWRRNITAPGMASSAAVHKLRELWGILADYLPEADRHETYLFSILKHAHSPLAKDVLQGGQIQWERVPAVACGLGIEAVKDRLKHQVKNSPQITQRAQI